jgi:hypothetical protein
MKQVHIDHMLFRLPGLTPQEAHEVGRNVGLRLSQRVESLQTFQQVDTLHLSLRLRSDASPEEMVDVIVEAILERIQRT